MRTLTGLLTQLFKALQAALLSRGRYSPWMLCWFARRSAKRLFAPFDLLLFSNPAARMATETVAQTLGSSSLYGPNDYP